MPGKDPAHWLHRLDAAEWLAAAEQELALAGEALQRRAVRPGVTHARRGAGMALNAVLVLEDHAHPHWGRSYMEHVVAIETDAAVPDDVRAAAHLLRVTPPAPPELVQLGKPDNRALDAARRIVDWTRTRVTARSS